MENNDARMDSELHNDAQNAGTEELNQSPPPVQEAYRKEYFYGTAGQESAQQRTGEAASANATSPAGHSAASGAAADTGYGNSYNSSHAQNAGSGNSSGYGSTYGSGNGPTYGAGAPPYGYPNNGAPYGQTGPAGKVRKQRRPKSGKKNGRLIAGAILLLVLCIAGGTLGGFLGSRWYISRYGAPSTGGTIYESSGTSTNPSQDGAKAETDTPPASSAPGEMMSIPELVKQTSPAVVAIRSKVRSQDIFGQTMEGVAAGSGVIINEKGYIVTNSHVVAGGKEIEVALSDGSTHSATLVGQNEIQDVAVLKIDGDGYKYLKFGDSSTLQVGESIIAIGNPLGELQGTVTEGLISALHRDIEVEGTKMFDLIQTDAAINHGNSGGALINRRGELIGVNVARSESGQQSGTVVGIAFAIPAETVKRTVDEIMDPNYKQPYLGIIGDAVSPQMQSAYKLPQGVWLANVEKGSPADKAGLQRRDIITKVDGREVGSVTDIRSILNQHKVGDKLSIEIDRNGENQTVELTLEGRAS